MIYLLPPHLQHFYLPTILHTCLADSNNLCNLINYVNIELQKLSNWFDANKMAINISKTKFIIFRSRGKKIDNEQARIFVNTNEIGVANDPQKIFELQRVYTAHDNCEHRD